MTASFDCVIAGAGVIGLAIGRHLALQGIDVAVLDAEDNIGSHTSSRNSEVIHAGLYYPQDSLKARLCVAGKHALYEYCESRGIPHRRIGKVLVATDASEEEKLERIRQSAIANGVEDLEFVSAATLAQKEPAVRSTLAIWSPSTGIVDSHEYMMALQADIEEAGGVVVTRSKIVSVTPGNQTFDIVLDGIDEAFCCNRFVNSAGLWATQIADTLGVQGLSPHRFFLARGHYFSYSGRSPFNHLVYPVPIDGGLGIHATNDLAGFARFGPDAEWIDRIDYNFSEGLRDKFLPAIRRYFPTVDADRLNPSYSGIRPKLYGKGEPSADFRIDGPSDHGIPGLVNLFGMESPGLTASLAIAVHVGRLLNDSA